jgi:hypothetical protein
MAEPTQEIRIVVRADYARLRASRGHPRQPPTGVDQTGQDKNQEQIRHTKTSFI